MCWRDRIRGRPSWGEPLTEALRHGEKFLLGTPASSSASANLSDDATETPRNPVRQNARQILVLLGFKRIAPDQDTGMDLNEPWVTALGLFNAGGDFRGHLRNQFLTSTSAWANLFLRPATRSGKSASDIWTYCHKSIYPEAQKGRRLLNRRRAQSIIQLPLSGVYLQGVSVCCRKGEF